MSVGQGKCSVGRWKGRYTIFHILLYIQNTFNAYFFCGFLFLQRNVIFKVERQCFCPQHWHLTPWLSHFLAFPSDNRYSHHSCGKRGKRIHYCLHHQHVQGRNTYHPASWQEHEHQDCYPVQKVSFHQKRWVCARIMPLSVHWIFHTTCFLNYFCGTLFYFPHFLSKQITEIKYL